MMQVPLIAKINSSKLYAVTQSDTFDGLMSSVKLALEGGVDIIQYRDKSDRSDIDHLKIIRSLSILIKDYGKVFIVNNRIDLAILGNADGVHLGHEDIPVKDALKMVPKGFIIGRSTHSLEEALQAEKDGASYVGIGPLFPTPTKPLYKPIGFEIAVLVQKTLSIPAFAIGNINKDNLLFLIEKGINRVAFVREIFNSDDILNTTSFLRKMIYGQN